MCAAFQLPKKSRAMMCRRCKLRNMQPITDGVCRVSTFFAVAHWLLLVTCIRSVRPYSIRGPVVILYQMARKVVAIISLWSAHRSKLQTDPSDNPD